MGNNSSTVLAILMVESLRVIANTVENKVTKHPNVALQATLQVKRGTKKRCKESSVSTATSLQGSTQRIALRARKRKHPTKRKNGNV
jgi:hypothetical protein